MLPRAKTKLGRFIEDALTYALFALIVLGVILMFLNPLLKLAGIHL